MRIKAVNKSGQMLGRKGNHTRTKIVEATERLLTTSRGIPPSLSAIAREAEISPPTFYLYFNDVAEAIYATIERLVGRLEPVVALLRQEWPTEESYKCSLRFVKAYFDYWDKNSALLRARNQLADEGNKLFVQSRLASVELLGSALAAKLKAARVKGKIIAHPDDIAGILLTAIERTATIAVLNLYPDLNRDWKKSVQALAYQLSLNVTSDA